MGDRAIGARRARGRARWLVVVVAAVLAIGCKRKHVAVAAPPELPYPTCADAEARVVVASGHLRAGPTAREQTVVERFQLARDACHFVFTGHEEWPLMTADVEVVYDADLAPLRAWKRMTIPGVTRADGNADTRSYDARPTELTIKRRAPDGVVSFELLRPGGRTAVAAGAKPMAVIAPGRGVLTAWFRRAKLKPGEKRRELALDMREMVETLSEVTLARDEDRFEPSLGKTVRVYTIYGREAVFADDDDVVVGDLMGMRPSASLTTPEPAPMPTYGAPDPAHTP